MQIISNRAVRRICTVIAFSMASLFSGMLVGYWADRSKGVRKIALFMNLFQIAGNILYFIGFFPWILLLGRFVSGTKIIQFQQCIHNNTVLTPLCSLRNRNGTEYSTVHRSEPIDDGKREDFRSDLHVCLEAVEHQLCSCLQSRNCSKSHHMISHNLVSILEATV